MNDQRSFRVLFYLLKKMNIGADKDGGTHSTI